MQHHLVRAEVSALEPRAFLPRSRKQYDHANQPGDLHFQTSIIGFKIVMITGTPKYVHLPSVRMH